ncbi:Neurexin 1, isoform A [Haplosporangium sp. Z 27]|nr:Neurexin 1, isoform A [Haplosporangium sp. Z 27]
MDNIPTTLPQTADGTVQARATVDKRQSILFRIKLQDSAGNHVPVYEVANKLIGFFCGAGRYAVCQELAATADEFLEKHPGFAIVYVSLDTTEEAFKRTMEAHPKWLAVPYNDPIRIDLLNDWQTKGVPSLGIYDPIEHEVLTNWGGSCLRFNFDNCYDIWKQGGEGVTFWQIIKGWWWYKAPAGVYKDLSEEELAKNGFPKVSDSADSSNSVESKKNK